MIIDKADAEFDPDAWSRAALARELKTGAVNLNALMTAASTHTDIVVHKVRLAWPEPAATE